MRDVLGPQEHIPSCRARHDAQQRVAGQLKRSRIVRRAEQRWEEVPRASLCSLAVAYARSFPYDGWRGNLIVIVSYGWKEWIDGNQAPRRGLRIMAHVTLLRLWHIQDYVTSAVMGYGS
jgi:hypothetical protein